MRTGDRDINMRVAANGAIFDENVILRRLWKNLPFDTSISGHYSATISMGPSAFTSRCDITCPGRYESTSRPKPAGAKLAAIQALLSFSTEVG